MRGAGVLIAGFGNRLMGDDGVGPEVADRLGAADLPPGVEVVEAESDSLILPQLWHGQGAVWMIDAVIRGAASGTIHRLDHDEILAIPQRHATVHHLSLPESLRWIAHAYPEMAGVRFRLWGIEPEHVELGAGLGRAAQRAARTVVDEIISALREI